MRKHSDPVRFWTRSHARLLRRLWLLDEGRLRDEHGLRTALTDALRMVDSLLRNRYGIDLAS